jgi:hypothetical protein
MKANEAPEKIYINDFGSELSYDWHTEHCCESDIEYTRTDAFIEKACKWLEKHVTYIHPRKGKEECIVNLARFMNDMKGE